MPVRLRSIAAAALAALAVAPAFAGPSALPSERLHPPHWTAAAVGAADGLSGGPVDWTAARHDDAALARTDPSSAEWPVVVGRPLALWSLGGPGTGDGDLDLLLDLPNVPGDANRPVGTHSPDGSSPAASEFDLLRAIAPAAANSAAPGHGLRGLDVAATLLPQLTERTLFRNAEALGTRVYEPLPGMREWALVEAAARAREAAAIGEFEQPAADRVDDRTGRRLSPGTPGWVSWPSEAMYFIRANWAWLIGGVAASAVLAAALKAYSRRI